MPLPFDGVKAILNAAPWRVDAFATKPVDQIRGFSTTRRIYRHGFGESMPCDRSHSSMVPTSTSIFGDSQQIGHLRAETGTESRQTVGTRLWGVRGAWDSDSEFVGQTGTFGHGYILAWNAVTDTGYTLEPVPLQPRLRATRGYHERRPRQKWSITFRLHLIISHWILFQPGDSLSSHKRGGGVHPNLTVHWGESIALNGEWGWFWRQSASDGIYGLGSNLLRPVGTTKDTYEGGRPR